MMMRKNTANMYEIKQMNGNDFKFQVVEILIAHKPTEIPSNL